MCNNQPNSIKETISETTKGVDNEHELLKCAETDDQDGIMKYSIDLDPGEEKISK